LVPITGIIGSNPNPRFVDLKLASDEAGLKAEAHLPQKELIRKDAFPYQSVRGDHFHSHTHYGTSVIPLAAADYEALDFFVPRPECGEPVQECLDRSESAPQERTFGCIAISVAMDQERPLALQQKWGDSKGHFRHSFPPLGSTTQKVMVAGGIGGVRWSRWHMTATKGPSI
jgi:hypothetical protein